MVTDRQIRVIDADGHILERKEDVARYLEAPWQDRIEVWPGGQPWDAEVEMYEPPPYNFKEGLSPTEQMAIWNRVLDEHQIDGAALFSSNGSGAI